MPQNSHVLFIQKRSTRAGAQTSLARMMKSSLMRGLHPAVLIGSHGWLHEFLSARGIPVVYSHFPRPRRLQIQLMGLGNYGRNASRLLAESGIRPHVIIANDHTECPLALEISRCYGGIPVLGLLRTPGMTRRDFQKFQCDGCGQLMAVGEELKAKVEGWTHQSVGLFQEGFSTDELHKSLPWPDRFPERLLVVGSEQPRKGFTDFIQALDLLEEKYPDFPALQCDFTGGIPNDESLMAKPRRANFRFLGRVNDYVNLVRRYPLVIHPSRLETFGLAPLEAILAGAPTMLSSTGAVQQLEVPSHWTFPPQQPEEIASRIEALWRAWPGNGGDMEQLQQEIAEKFHIDQTVRSLHDAVKSMGKSSGDRKKRFLPLFSPFRKVI